MITEKQMNIVTFDFDGVIHSYLSGWQGITETPDPPVDGIKEEIERIREAGYKVVVFSARCRDKDGIVAIKKYLTKHNIVVDDVAETKPPAIVSIDDRVICFNGDPKGLKEQIDKFKPWMEK